MFATSRLWVMYPKSRDIGFWGTGRPGSGSGVYLGLIFVNMSMKVGANPSWVWGRPAATAEANNARTQPNLGRTPAQIWSSLTESFQLWPNSAQFDETWLELGQHMSKSSHVVRIRRNIGRLVSTSATFGRSRLSLADFGPSLVVPGLRLVDIGLNLVDLAPEFVEAGPTLVEPVQF